MDHHFYAKLVALLLVTPSVHTAFSQSDEALRGSGCIPPTVAFTTTADDPALLCQGDVISVNGSFSTAATGHSIEQWIWNYGVTDGDTSAIPFAILPFPNGGVHLLTLEVIDDIGCSSGPSASVAVLVSPTPEFTTTSLPATICGGVAIPLVASAVQPLMIGGPTGCTAPVNGIALADSPAPPTLSTLEVSGQPSGVITDVTQLGDICMDIEHSFMGDLVLSVICPNGQSVVLHQQGGGGTFLGDANDSDGGSVIVPGVCFQYCFGADPDHGTLVDASTGGANPNTVPVTQGNAIAPGRYSSVEPLSQLIGCPFNGTWTFSAFDNWAADNGYLCGWCISFGSGADSTYVDQGPILGTSADSSFWTGPGVFNTPGQPGSATFNPAPGNQTITYTVIDSYGCQHETSTTVSIGEQPEVTIVENPDLGLFCAEVVGGPVTYQWSFQGSIVVGAAGSCFTPPGPGLVSVTVQNSQGCTGSDLLLITALNDLANNSGDAAFLVVPNPNDGAFSIRFTNMETASTVLRVVDMSGRTVHESTLGAAHGTTTTDLRLNVAPGVYFVELFGTKERPAQRIIIQ